MLSLADTGAEERLGGAQTKLQRDSSLSFSLKHNRCGKRRSGLPGWLLRAQHSNCILNLRAYLNYVNLMEELYQNSQCRSCFAVITKFPP